MILQFSGGLHHRAVAFFILHFQRYSIRESEHTKKLITTFVVEGSPGEMSMKDI